MAEKRKFSSRRDSPGQSVFKQDLFLLSVPTGSTSDPGTDRVLATDKDGRVVSVIGGSGVLVDQMVHQVHQEVV